LQAALGLFYPVSPSPFTTVHGSAGLDRNPDLLIVIATYNEIDNLPRLVANLVERLPDAQIMIIDDASPDGTGKWCDEASSRYTQLSVVHREAKLGLGSATMLGFQRALSRNFLMVATMDADFSHDPVSLVKLVDLLRSDVDQEIGVAIGSRYVPGGAIEGWSLFRKTASWAVNRYSRLMLRLKTKDNSGAFRVYRCSALKTIDLATIRSAGYGYLEEILWRLNQVGVKMEEVPICFRNRERGKSKTSLVAGVNVFWQITKMGLGKWGE
jgi:dolichol-phosphate mannosyltransferase